MKKSVIVLALLLVALSATSAIAASNKAGLSLPVGGNFTDLNGGTGRFAGTFFLQDFAVQNGAIVGEGILSGTLTNADGTVVGSVWRQVAMPVTPSSGSSALAKATQSVVGSIQVEATCPILHLELGPLDLNLLGLVVHLNKVVLDISAQSGGGNLLGNLLCAVANLLNGGFSLSQISDLLNQILQILIGSLV
jgi:hypothetical protein